MSAWDVLSLREQQLVVTALQLAPIEEDGGLDATEEELARIAEKLSPPDPFLADLQDLAGDIAHATTEMRDKALVSMVEQLRGMTGDMAESLGGVVIVADALRRIVTLPSGEDELDGLLTTASAMLIQWKAAQVAVDEFIKSVKNA